MANRISKILKNQKKGMQFLKSYNQHKRLKGKSKKEFNAVLEKTVSKLVMPRFRYYFSRTRLRNLLCIYSITTAWLLALLVAIIVVLQMEINNSFITIYKKDFFLIILFFILGLLGLAIANLIINIARFNLWKQIIQNNQVIILENLLKEFKINNITFLPEQKKYLVVEVKPIKMFIPKNKKHRIINLEAEEKINNSIYFNDKKLISTFSESFINQQIKSILLNKQMHAVFKEINLNFENSKNGKITLNIRLNLHLILIIIFITSMFVIYTYNSQKK